MPSFFNPFSGIGKIASYIRWNRFREASWRLVLSKALKKFGGRWRNYIQQHISNFKATERAAQALRASKPSRDISEITLPLGKNRSKTIRVTAQFTKSPFKYYVKSKTTTHEIVIDAPRSGSKRKLVTTLREKILDAFFDHYDIANKYRPAFRKKFGNVEITEIEGV